ncbi:MAG: rod-binding protein [Spirochaetes bacterium]|nr:rod-binding protein [Spirochaetota bacterium]
MAMLTGIQARLSPLELAPGQEAKYRRSQEETGDALRLDKIRGLKNPKEQLRRVSEEMESLFVKMMYSAMKKTVHKEEGMLHGGQAEEVFDDMLTEEYSRRFAKSRSFGIADVIYKTYEKSVK